MTLALELITPIVVYFLYWYFVIRDLLFLLFCFFVFISNMSKLLSGERLWVWFVFISFFLLNYSRSWLTNSILVWINSFHSPLPSQSMVNYLLHIAYYLVWYIFVNGNMCDDCKNISCGSFSYENGDKQSFILHNFLIELMLLRRSPSFSSDLLTERIS